VLKIVVIVMGVLIIGGMGVIGVTMVRRITSASTDTVETTATTATTVAGFGPSFGQVELAVPAGARLVEMDVDGDRLVLHLETADGPRILVIDLTTGKTVGAIDLAPAP
jgi:uncharacterized membrane protein